MKTLPGDILEFQVENIKKRLGESQKFPGTIQRKWDNVSPVLKMHHFTKAVIYNIYFRILKQEVVLQ